MRPSTCAAGATAPNAAACNPSKTSSPSSRTTGMPVIAWHASRLNNGLLEGINSLVQVAKARARGSDLRKCAVPLSQCNP